MASILKEHEEVLLRFIFELREQGIQVSLGMVALKASSLSRLFKEKTTNAKEKIVSQFVASHGLNIVWGHTNHSMIPANSYRST